MKIIQGDRCSGRTTAAVKMAIETGSILVVSTFHMAKNLKRINPGLKAMPAQEFLGRGYRTNNSYIIDDIDYLFNPHRIIAFTTSGEVSRRLKQFKPGKKIKRIKRLF
jgi:hypothetical protein